MGVTGYITRGTGANIPCLQARTCLEIRNLWLKDQKSVLEILTMFHHCCGTRYNNVLKPKCTKLELAPDPAGGAQHSPDPLAGYRGSYPTSKGREGREGAVGKGKREEGMDPSLDVFLKY